MLLFEIASYLVTSKTENRSYGTRIVLGHKLYFCCWRIDTYTWKFAVRQSALKLYLDGSRAFELRVLIHCI